MGRLIGQAVSSRIGQPVVIENIGGAGGSIALRTMTSANPDGYTLLVHSVGPVCTASLLYKLNFEPTKLFIPVGTFATDSASSSWGRRSPPKRCGSSSGTQQPIPANSIQAERSGPTSTRWLRSSKHGGLEYPAYSLSCGAAAVTDLLGGQIHMIVNNKSVLSHSRSKAKSRRWRSPARRDGRSCRTSRPCARAGSPMCRRTTAFVGRHIGDPALAHGRDVRRLRPSRRAGDHQRRDFAFERELQQNGLVIDDHVDLSGAGRDCGCAATIGNTRGIHAPVL